MILEATRRIRQTGKALLFAAALVGTGCKNGPEQTQAQQLQNQQMDWLDKQSGLDMSRREPTAVRSQNPNVEFLAPAPQAPIVPVNALSKIDPADGGLPVQRDAQVRIVATIGTTPIYEREVREAVYQHTELFTMPAHERKIKEKEMYKEELRKIVERELILDELFSMLGQHKQDSALKQLKEAAAKEADKNFKDIQKRFGLPNEQVLKEFLQIQGLTMAGLRRQFERNMMMGAYLAERVKPKASNIGPEVRDYYDDHPDEFQHSDSLKWQDLFVRLDRFNSPEDAKKYADWLFNRAKNEEFAKLLTLDQGISKSNGGFGHGEKKGEISPPGPPELEPQLFSMKKGEVAMVPIESGYHIVRIAERTYAGKRPFDEKVQDEIRKKLNNVTSEREYRKIVDSLWRRYRPQIIED
jgi:peptidyl-prolyl cis-trans isomerase SurA